MPPACSINCFNGFFRGECRALVQARQAEPDAKGFSFQTNSTTVDVAGEEGIGPS